MLTMLLHRSTNPRRRFPAILLGVSLAVAVTLVGCGDEEVATDDCTVVEPGSDGRTVLELGADNMAFDFDCVEVQAGPVDITFDNRDSGVAHNLKVAGEATELTAGPDVQELTVDLEVGDHDVTCDPHPNMKAVIVAV